MKKYILAIVAVLGLAFGTQAASHKFTSLLNGYDPSVNVGLNPAGRTATVLLPVNTTNTMSTSNVTYYVQANPFGVTYGTNLTLVTNVLINPVVWAANQGTNVFYIQNTSFLVNTNSGSPITTPSALVDVGIYPNANGDPASTCFTLTVTGDNANCTNAATFVLGHSADGINYGTGTADKISVTLTMNGTNQVSLSTNIVTSFTQGQTRLRLLTYSALASPGSTNIYINSAGIGGFVP